LPCGNYLARNIVAPELTASFVAAAPSQLEPTCKSEITILHVVIVPRSPSPWVAIPPVPRCLMIELTGGAVNVKTSSVY